MPMGKIYKQKKAYGPIRKVPPQIKHYVNRQIARNTENKMVVYNAAASFNLLSTTWTELDVAAIGTGAGLINRIGRQIKLKSLEVDMLIDKADVTNVFKIVIGMFAGQLTTPLTTAGATMNTAITKNNLNGLIKKYLDKFVVCDGVRQSIAHFKYFKKFKNTFITWAGDNSNPDKRLFMSIISDSGAVSHPFSSYGKVILRFEDA